MSETEKQAPERQNKTYAQSLLHQWRTGTGIFGPLIQSTPQEKAADEEARRQQKLDSVHAYREPQTDRAKNPARPSLMKRLSSAVELVSFRGSASSPFADQNRVPSTPPSPSQQMAQKRDRANSASGTYQQLQ